MAGRPPKKGIDYSGWSVDIFDNDTKIDKLLDAHGWDGFGIYFYLCQRAYGSDGYFYKWGFDDCASTARKMGGGLGSGTIREVVGYCLQIGLFDKGLFDRWGVLTSRGIQKRYMEVIKGRDVKEVITEYWLLQKNEECKGLLKLPLNMDLSKGNTDFPEGNSKNGHGNDIFPIQKESKEKERKENRETGAGCYFGNPALNEAFCFFLAYRKNKFRENLVPETIALMAEELERIAPTDEERIAALNKAVYKGWKNFYPADKKSKSSTDTDKNKFNNCEPRDYDMDSLEKQLLGRSRA